MGFGLTFDKLLIIGLIALVLIGPERLPAMAAKLAQLIRGIRGYADQAKTRLRDEMGPEFDEVDWKQLDPRQYDPRRIIRDALAEPAPGVAAAAAAPASKIVKRESAFAERKRLEREGKPAPFDSEAT